MKRNLTIDILRLAAAFAVVCLHNFSGSGVAGAEETVALARFAVPLFFLFSGYFCALGKSGISFLHNSLSIVLVRIPLSWITSRKYPDNLFPMGLAAPLGSLLSAGICVAAYLILSGERRRRGDL